MTVSVALTTYNGMKYIKEQLDSIAGQTYTPEEVVIIDDCSTDGTYEYVCNYIRERNLSGWVVLQNPENQGWKRNFRIAFQKCRGDFIFLCDQDDVWHDYKIYEMKKVMENNPCISLLVSNYSVMDIDREEKVRIPGLNKNDGAVTRLPFQEHALTLMRPGCTYCAAKSLIDKLWEKDLIHEPHDQMLWNYAAINDGLYLFNRITMRYRRHSDSASTPELSLSKKRRYQEMKESVRLCGFFVKRCEEQGMDDKVKIINGHIRFVTERARMLKRGALVKLLFFQIKNHKHYATLRNMLSDEYLIVFRK